MLEMIWNGFSVLLRVTFVTGLLALLAWSLSEQLDRDDKLRVRWFLKAIADALKPAAEWGATAARRLYGRTIRRLEGRYLQWCRQRTTRHLVWAQRGFGPEADQLFPLSLPIRSAVLAWYEAAPLALAAYMLKAYVFLRVTLNAGALTAAFIRWSTRLWERSANVPRPWWSPPGPGNHSAALVKHQGEGTGLSDLVTTFVAGIRGDAEWVWHRAAPYVSALADPADKPVKAVTGAAACVFAAAFLLALRAFFGLFGFRRGQTPQEQQHAPRFGNPIHRWRWVRSLLSLRVGSARRTRPVVVLVNCLAQVGAARQYYRAATDNHWVLVAPRVNLSAAERVVWSAARTRHTWIGPTSRHQHRRHAGEVVGALRAVQARQDNEEDTGRVFEDMVHLLTKIAERYARGRTLALLDPEDTNGVEAAVNRDWLRLLVLGTVMTGAAVGAGLSEISAAGSTQIVAVVGAVAWVLLYRDRLSPSDVLDVMRGQSRK
ncbi:hypothetical protein AB0E62_32865 [Streptomyces sp. NPDC038707]|uniref:hypothetical protein n=1 Tax=Streptomyces sp. NPDC038707 TaxID=3154329 RepID=UPI0033E17C7B